MSESSIPTYVDTRRVFSQVGNISGSVSLDRLPRFRECLANDTATIMVELGFEISESKRQLIVGRLQAEVFVTCQRCLQPLAIELSDDIMLALLRDEEAIAELESGIDPWICTDNKLELASLVEEQLMLCLPLVSYHDGAECIDKSNYVAGQIDTAVSTSSENPFSVLKTLKESDPTD